ncbi:hypothetical protein NUACC21_22210 [Scytonema sp. NUACC21]
MAKSLAFRVSDKGDKVATGDRVDTGDKVDRENGKKLSPSPHLQVSPSSSASSNAVSSAKVWVIDRNKQTQRESYIWVVKDTKKIGQQPFLQVQKNLDKSEESSEKAGSSAKPSPKDEFEAFDKVIKDTEKLDGLFTLYKNKKENKVYLEIKPSQLSKNFLATATLESGIGEAGIYSGIPLQDFLFYFERINNKVNFTVRNVNFRAGEGDPQRRSLARSFSDSVLYSLPIKSIHPQRKTILIDLGDLLLTDLAGLSFSLGITPGTDKSYFGNVKAFPLNMVVETVLNFSSTNGSDNAMFRYASLPDSRGFSLRVHYSFSQLSDNGYRPRLADDRVGYFISAYQDLSNDDRNDPFVRYINRWNLEKQNPNAAISPPKKPIVFWIDNAIPLEYRDAVKEGVLMWNKAFDN